MVNVNGGVIEPTDSKLQCWVRPFTPARQHIYAAHGSFQADSTLMRSICLRRDVEPPCFIWSDISYEDARLGGRFAKTQLSPTATIDYANQRKEQRQGSESRGARIHVIEEYPQSAITTWIPFRTTFKLRATDKLRWASLTMFSCDESDLGLVFLHF